MRNQIPMPPGERMSLLERPRYFPRQLITPEEMTLEQDYFRRRLRLHNRMLHGWGVVCGALVCLSLDEDREPRPFEVKVCKGYVLGPYGDEIILDAERVVDLRHPERPDAALDPWCRLPETEPVAGAPIYVAVKAGECATRPVRVPPLGCGCDATQCEYSRWVDTYEIGLLDACPASHHGPPPDLDDIFRGGVPECPECPSDPWVVLAKVVLGDGGEVEVIDNCSCRRMVLGLAQQWWRPGARVGEAELLTIDHIFLDGYMPADHPLFPGGEAWLEIGLTGIPRPPSFQLGPGIDVVEIGELGLGALVGLAPRLYRGDHLELNGVHLVRGARVEATSDEEVLIDLDGEMPGRLPAVIELLPAALKLRVRY